MAHVFQNYPLSLSAGTAAAPALNFSDAATGFYRYGLNQIGGTINGSHRFLFDAVGLQILGTYAQVINSGAAASFRAYTYRDSASQSQVTLYCARGTSTSPANLQTGDGVGSVSGAAWTTGTTFVVPGQYRLVAIENHSATALGTKAVIYTCPNGSTAQAVAASFGEDKSLQVVGGLGVWNTKPPASKPTLTGDLSTYNETNYKALLTLLAACGILTDSTTT